MKKLVQKMLAVSSALCMTLSQSGLIKGTAAQEKEFDFSYLGAVGVFDEAQTQKIAEQIYQGLVNHQENITVGSKRSAYIESSMDAIQASIHIFRSVISTWDVGILTSRLSVSYTVPQGGVMQLCPVYLEDEHYEDVYSDLMQELDKITCNVDSQWSDAEKALYLHDYLAVNYDYDYTQYTDSKELELQHTAYGMLKNKKAVCEGYAWLYGILLHEVGVNSMMVISNEMLHAWNLLNIDGNWYHTDVTWDDGYNTHPGIVQHKNFLKDTHGN